MEDPQKVLELTVQAGQLLLENGAEVFRVQQTMEIMAAAYGETEFHVYVLTNGIFASLGRDGRQHMARVGHVPQSSVHLGRVDAVNTLSRQIAAGQVPLEEAMARIEQIRAIPVLPLWQQVLACGAGTGFFAILFGGGWREFGCAFVAGILLQLFLWQAEGRRLNKIITRLLGAALVLSGWLAFQGAVLHRQRPSVAGYFSAPVEDGAMEPALSQGDAAILRQGQDFSPGDIVAFVNQAGELSLRRVVGTSGEAYITQGDSMDQPDETLLSPGQVAGRCVAALPGAGVLLQGLSSPWGTLCLGALWLLVVLLPAGLTGQKAEAPGRHHKT